MNTSANPDTIMLEHGSGGALSRELVSSVIYPYFKKDHYPELNDASPLHLSGDLLMTTDMYTVNPVFFPGGNIGSLCVHGTCNDLAVCGGKPHALSLGMIIEEGFLLEDLRKILESISKTAESSGVSIITGDTKVVPRGKGGGIYLNTCGIGRNIAGHHLSVSAIRPGDRIIISAPVGTHGIAVMTAREKLSIGAGIESDAAALFPLCEKLLSFGEDLRFMRDATRGGAAAVLNEMISDSPFGMEIRESDIPVREDVASISKILGLNPLEVANEGVLTAVVAAPRLQEALECLREHPLGREAACAGEITETHPGKVVLETPIGGKRILGLPRGILLPRIC